MAMPTSVDLNIANLLWSVASADGPSTAVIERGRKTSYGELRARGAAIAQALLAAGLHPEDRVAILLENGVDAVAAFFGVLAAGGIAIILNQALRPRQMAQMLGHSGAALLVTSAALPTDQEPRLDTAYQVLCVEDITAAEDLVPVGRAGADPAQIIYTSGSTGQPKGVVVSHANLWASMRAVTSYLGITRADRVAGILPFSFVYGMSQVLCAVGTGAALVVERSPLATRLVAELRTQRVTVLAAVPPLWLQLLGVPAFQTTPLPDLRIVTNAGGRLPVAAVRAVRQSQPQAQLFLMYGLTEALRCTYLPPEEVDLSRRNRVRPARRPPPVRPGRGGAARALRAHRGAGVLERCGGDGTGVSAQSPPRRRGTRNRARRVHGRPRATGRRRVSVLRRAPRSDDQDVGVSGQSRRGG
jgi:acyl-CoA synthetase (AMP-forming)/AMP-acid ligase II